MDQTNPASQATTLFLDPLISSTATSGLNQTLPATNPTRICSARSTQATLASSNGTSKTRNRKRKPSSNQPDDRTTSTAKKQHVNRNTQALQPAPATQVSQPTPSTQASQTVSQAQTQARPIPTPPIHMIQDLRDKSVTDLRGLELEFCKGRRLTQDIKDQLREITLDYQKKSSHFGDTTRDAFRATLQMARCLQSIKRTKPLQSILLIWA
ncbi:hypothetical protein PGT21_022389 [Puccinia graminis f. sp. tritici]|uniref:Uncharacterized protein n=1 Tax=Puccinia graminis f. sp. tritici TaxID=56615 RepID=A0A5B0MJI5_PUCGR|nr:hypothetical protein PGT21_022389 [Puccinia graminis f. sp. tritici]